MKMALPLLNKIGVRLPTWAVALIAARIVLSPAILAALGAASLLFLIFGNASSVNASNCLN